jgi:ribosomal protein S18 acetylase RimI-like enzyme
MTSKIIGLSFCEDVATKDPDELYLNSTPKFNPLDALIAEMLQYYATQFLSQETPNQNLRENNFDHSTTQTQTQTQTNSRPHHESAYSFLNYNAQYNLPKGEHFRIAFLAVSNEFRGQGIGRTLVTKSIEIARQRGYKYVVCEASSETSQRLFRSLGFKLIKLFKYKEFVWNGQYPLASIADSEGCALMGMNLLSS